MADQKKYQKDSSEKVDEIRLSLAEAEERAAQAQERMEAKLKAMQDAQKAFGRGVQGAQADNGS